jgi:hypothetical protein
MAKMDYTVPTSRKTLEIVGNCYAFPHSLLDVFAKLDSWLVSPKSSKVDASIIDD